LRRGKLFVIVVLLWAMPLVAAAQETAGSATEGQKLTVKVTPSDKGCSVALSTKVGKALGTPEGLATPTLGERGKEPLPSLITCLCGAQSASKECPQGGTCACSPPGGNPSVVCN